MNLKRLFAGLITVIVVTGCSMTPTTPTKPVPESIEQIQSWQTEGRVGIRTETDAISGNFNWSHNTEHYELNIYGPFGQGATRLEGTPGSEAKLSYDDKVAKGESAEALLYYELGWHFPVTNVQYWIRGLASPNTPAETAYREDGTPEQIIQDGWTITYKEFTNVDQLKLPQRMQVVHTPYRVNLIITDWAVQ
ncbi:lipoprotein insertase outer membrane protein LolB [Marinomonas ostreistagni]|uniref:Outer-membrane lipoprotein LolB n=1 Tax=Marinomonas ostreistagni TaxID=359209 RepID=A0ABS0Z7B5_9GAMM|nr:lipoprotein insertase outer membrane protein LolB [Marinomonas ostreistagni]MBJ7549318.1 outer membrane lipoprotein LolB [Marinomonas ostreistagni]